MLYFGGTWVGCYYLNSSIHQLYWEFKITSEEILIQKLRLGPVWLTFWKGV